MNTDIRINVGFLTHQKTIATRKAIGNDGVVCLLQLWCWAACNRSDGDLTGLTDGDVERVAGWGFSGGVFAGLLRSLGWADGEPGAMRLHAWKERQGWASHASKRAIASSIAANARWRKRFGNGSDMRRADALKKKAHDAPSPSPSPSRTAKNLSASPPGFKPFVDAFDAAYRAGHGGAKPTWGKKQGAQVKSILAKHPLDECLRRLAVLRDGRGPDWIVDWDLGAFVAHFDKLAPTAAAKANGQPRCPEPGCAKYVLAHSGRCLEHTYDGSG